MSAERVDHAATAHALLVAADAHPHDPDIPVDPWTLQAQVHATLALVEQQRIANIIALGQVCIGSDVPLFRHLVVEPVDGHGVRPTVEIREGLGL